MTEHNYGGGSFCHTFAETTFSYESRCVNTFALSKQYLQKPYIRTQTHSFIQRVYIIVTLNVQNE